MNRPFSMLYNLIPLPPVDRKGCRLAAAVVVWMLPMTAVACRASSAGDVAGILQTQTQELLDSIAVGDRTPWSRYVDDDIVYAAEDGSRKTKQQLLEEIQPFPKEIWGKLHITNFHTVFHRTMAVTNYIIEEQEGYFGQVIRARYVVTDTWVEVAGAWRLAASQVLAMRDDPPAVELTPVKLDEYVGVYSLTPEITYTIRRERDGLLGQRTGRKAETLRPEVADYFFVPGQPRLRKVFQRDGTGRITGFVERRESWDIAWRRRRD
jgi:Domain of unknown function (DUF4440)